MAEYESKGAQIEGQWVADRLRDWRQLTTDQERDNILAQYREEMRLLGNVLQGNSISQESETLLSQYGIQYDGSVMARTSVIAQLSQHQNLVNWMVLDEGFTYLEALNPDERRRMIRALELKSRFYCSRGYDKIAGHLDQVATHMDQINANERVYHDVTITDSDDAYLMTRMGALHPDMLNCFNPNGNPVFTQFVVNALGSKNMRLVVAREAGRIVAAAMMKVKQLPDGTPALFLERGVYRRGYNFRQEMLNHVAQKAMTMSPQPAVIGETRDSGSGEIVDVLGVGAYSSNEYVEAVFGLRDPNAVRHKGKRYVPASAVERSDAMQLSLQGLGDVTQEFVGIGTSNKSQARYLEELQEHGVRVVVDVRAAPRSRFQPHFNQNRMQEWLSDAGIEYQWLGELLGNPKDVAGQRTLAGFQSYMQTEEYERGITRLLEIIHQARGSVAITCAEGRESDCHRQFIIADLRRRLEI